MSAPKPGAKKTARRGLRTYRNAMRGAAAWAVAAVADLDALHSAWSGLGLEVA